MATATRPRTIDLARGKWRGILSQLGLSLDYLSGNHGPCPFCGGKDRYRWDNKDGSGSFFCSQCGSGDGFEILKRLNGWDFRTAAMEVDKVVGNVGRESVKPRMSESHRRDMLNRLWKAGKPVAHGDCAAAYLESRGIEVPKDTESLRYVYACPVPNRKDPNPAMIALVSGPEGEPVNIHRTFLGPNGKAGFSEPRAMMPGAIPDGAAVRLAPHGKVLGIAEGIETAIAAMQRFGVPVWAAINSTMLAKWQPPEGVEEVIIFADNDPKYGGAAAAYTLAHKLAVKGYRVSVKMPVQVGLDWADKDASENVKANAA